MPRGDLAVRELARLAERTRRREAKRKRVVSPTEQLRRFLDGEEAWRVEAGLVTEEQWERYVERMSKKLEERQNATL